MQTAALPHVGGSGSDENGSELPPLPSTLNLENCRVELSPRYGSFGLNPLRPDLAPVFPQFGQTVWMLEEDLLNFSDPISEIGSGKFW